jgi:hypothetical protein
MDKVGSAYCENGQKDYLCMRPCICVQVQGIEITKNEHITITHSLSFGVEMTTTSESESSILEVLKV